MSDYEDEAPGWDAIEARLTGRYGAQNPKHYGTALPFLLGGNDPLDGISAYRAEEPIPHWHLVTFGFSELYDKTWKDPDLSGFGFELTFRVVRTPEEEEPPAWALNLLQNMARYVFRSGNGFASGHFLDANGPICLGADTKLTALAFMEDPELPAADTPNGRVEFLQMVGITGDELEAMKLWNPLGVLEAGKAALPGYITDLARDSLLSIPSVAEAIELGTEREGSNTGILYVDQLEWEPGRNRLLGRQPAILTVGAKQADTLAKLLRGRLSKGKVLMLTGQGLNILLEPDQTTGYVSSESGIRLQLNDAAVKELTEKLRPREGTIRLSASKDVQVRIVKTRIKDQDGQVVETIG
ncbi:suppressor of fused domain protein [Gorillibacterium sp. sgz500922]|uniref:suppressor of fused domain protein n=1 Tax=Gorillibacterium sp. sgz500922 TaxID=3446694 RepID=UPI003F67D4AF